MPKLYVGIDNGVTGSIGAVRHDGTDAIQMKTPVFSQQTYTKKKRNLHRIDRPALKGLLAMFKRMADEDGHEIKIVMEAPMINPRKFSASISAARAFEATLTVLEDMELPFETIPAVQWQKVIFPRGTVEKDTKKLSNQMGNMLYPGKNSDGHDDYDGLMIAEYARRAHL